MLISTHRPRWRIRGGVVEGPPFYQPPDRKRREHRCGVFFYCADRRGFGAWADGRKLGKGKRSLDTVKPRAQQEN